MLSVTYINNTTASDITFSQSFKSFTFDEKFIICFMDNGINKWEVRIPLWNVLSFSFIVKAEEK